MELENLLFTFFIIIIVLTIVSLFPSRSQTGDFIAPSNVSLDLATVIIIFSIVVLVVIKIPKKHYNPVPYSL